MPTGMPYKRAGTKLEARIICQQESIQKPGNSMSTKINVQSQGWKSPRAKQTGEGFLGTFAPDL